LRRASRARASDGKALSPRREKGGRGERKPAAARAAAKAPPAKARGAPSPELLARHYQQLRKTRGTVLLGEPTPPSAAPKLERAWFVDGCPLDPQRAVEVIRTRHGFESRTAALRALRSAAEALRAAKRPEAEALADLP
jgi:hypothetical protein